MKLHSFRITCPSCKNTATIMDVMFGEDGTIFFDLACVICGKPLTFQTSWEKVIIFCSELSKTKVIMDIPATLQ